MKTIDLVIKREEFEQWGDPRNRAYHLLQRIREAGIPALGVLRFSGVKTGVCSIQETSSGDVIVIWKEKETA